MRSSASLLDERDADVRTVYATWLAEHAGSEARGALRAALQRETEPSVAEGLAQALAFVEHPRQCILELNEWAWRPLGNTCMYLCRGADSFVERWRGVLPCAGAIADPAP